MMNKNVEKFLICCIKLKIVSLTMLYISDRNYSRALSCFCVSNRAVAKSMFKNITKKDYAFLTTFEKYLI